MPFGVANTPALFQELMIKFFYILGRRPPVQELISREAEMEAHIDDLTLGTNTQEDHVLLLRAFSIVCQENHLGTKLEKCEFLKEEMEYLGFEWADKLQNFFCLQPSLIVMWPANVKQIVKTSSTWVYFHQRLEQTFPVYETDLSVRKQIEEPPMLPEFPSAARISEYVCDLEYLFSRMNVRSYGPTEPNLWLVGKIPTRTWEDCRSASERKRRTHTYDDPVDLLIELALERANDSHMEKFLNSHLGTGASPRPRFW